LVPCDKGVFFSFALTVQCLSFFGSLDYHLMLRLDSWALKFDLNLGSE
jgi:hypothetical protein